MGKLRGWLLIVGPPLALLLVTAGCSDSPTGPSLELEGRPPQTLPPPMIIPAGTDAETRLVGEIQDTVVRAQAAVDARSLGESIADSDGTKARQAATSLGALLAQYLTARGPTAPEGPDISAIMLLVDLAFFLFGPAPQMSVPLPYAEFTAGNSQGATGQLPSH